MAEDTLYQPGDIVPLQALFRNAAGTLTDTTVTLTITAPDGTSTTPSPTHPSTGTYTYNHALASNAPEGVWEAIFAGSGAVTATERKTFVVEPISLLGRISSTALATLADVRAFVFRDVLDDSQDRELVERINEYSRAITKYTNREWLPQTPAATRRFRYDGGGFLSFGAQEARTITAVTMFPDMPTGSQVTLTVASTTIEGQWRPFPAGKTDENTYLAIELPVIGRNYRWVDGDPYVGAGFANPSGYFRAPYAIDVTGDWGIAATLAGVPSDVQLAVKIAVADAYRNPEGFSSRQIGALSFTEDTMPEGSGEPRARNLPYEARALLEPYRRDRGYVFA